MLTSAPAGFKLQVGTSMPVNVSVACRSSAMRGGKMWQLHPAGHRFTFVVVLQLHNITPNTGVASRAVYSGWCPRVSRPDFIFDYQYM